MGLKRRPRGTTGTKANKIQPLAPHNSDYVRRSRQSNAPLAIEDDDEDVLSLGPYALFSQNSEGSSVDDILHSITEDLSELDFPVMTDNTPIESNNFTEPNDVNGDVEVQFASSRDPEVELKNLRLKFSILAKSLSKHQGAIKHISRTLKKKEKAVTSLTEEIDEITDDWEREKVHGVHIWCVATLLRVVDTCTPKAPLRESRKW